MILEAVNKSQKVYMEAYTSLLPFGLSPNGLSNLRNGGRKGRPMIEEAIDNDVAILVVGDPFGATTVKKLGVKLEVVHNAYVMNAVMNAVGICGLQLYHYGETVSIPFFTDTWRPDSFYEKIKKNRSLGLHTLCLLDIRVNEPTFESLCRGGKKQYEPPRYMTVNTAIEQLLEVERKRGGSVYGDETECVGVCTACAEDQKILAGTMKQLESVDFGAPLHCLVIVGKTHPVEEEMLEFYKYETAN